MADSNGKPKAAGKSGENMLSLLGSIAGVAGNLILGPDSMGMDLGAPFKAGAMMLRDKREQTNLMELLKTTPQTAALADHIPAIINAGGILKNPSILSHPDTQAYISQFPGQFPTAPGPGAAPQQPQAPAPQQATAGPISSPVPSPSGALLGALSPAQAPLDTGSDEFLQKAAALRPDIAEKLLLARGSKSNDPNAQMKEMLQTILLGKQIQSFETPEEKRQAALQDKLTTLDATDKLIGARQTEQKNEQQRLQVAKITPKEEQSFNDIDELRNNYRNMLVDLDAGVKTSYIKDQFGNLVPGGDRILQSTDPQFASFRKNVANAQAIYQKAISGVAISEQEAKRLRPTQPQAGDDMSVFKDVANNNIKKANELYLLKALNAANRGGDVSQYIPQEQVQAYKAVRAAMNHDLKAALANPRVQQLRQQLGIDYGAGKNTK